MPLTEIIGEVQRIYPNQQWLSRSRLAKIVGIPDESMKTAVEHSTVRTRKEPNCPHKSLTIPVEDFPGLVPSLVEQRSNDWLARQVRRVNLGLDFQFTTPIGGIVIFEHRQDGNISPVEVSSQWSQNPKIRDQVSQLLRDRKPDPSHTQDQIKAKNKSKIDLLSVLNWDEVKGQLTEREVRVIETRFGFKDHQQMLSKSDAARLLGMSSRGIQYIEYRALRRLAQIATSSKS